MTWIEPKKRVYICGPISGLPNLNRDAFIAMERVLIELGYDAVNPHNTCANIFRELYPNDKEHWKACMKADIAQLMSSDYILLLPGWDMSKGAKIEIALARELGINQLPTPVIQI